MQEDNGLPVRVAGLFVVDFMELRDVKRSPLVRFYIGIQASILYASQQFAP